MKKKKLNIALALLSASFLAVGLAACKGKDDEQNKPPVNNDEITISQIRETANNTIELTDAAEQADFEAALADFEVRNVDYDGVEPIGALKGSDCDVLFGENISYGHIGTYYVALKPKAEVKLTTGETEEVVKNPNGKYTRLIVKITHDWDKPNGDDRECKECHATYSTTKLAEGKEETLTIGAFHEGNNTLSGETIVHPYGEVATFTAGRLTKGTSITVNTYAKADASGQTWFFPIIGIADSDLGEYMGGYGTSVLVRNEGWTLINGIGSPRLLAALAGGANEAYNYGSRTKDTTDLDKRPDGYDAWKSNSKYSAYEDLQDGLPMTAADYLEWAAYSVGNQTYTDSYLPSEDNPLGVATNITWTYRDDGIIEMTVSNPGLKSELVARVKVPDNDKGYYDTIMHGESMTYTILGASYITPLTLEDITVKANTEKSYLANSKLDLADVTVSAKYQQDDQRHTETTGYEVFGFIPGAGTDKVGEDTGTFYNLDDYSLVPEMTHFKVVLTVGPNSAEATIEKKDFVKIVPNSVDLVLSTPITIDGETYSSTLSGATKELSGSADAKIVVNGVAATFTAAQKEKLGTTADKYVALRLYANEIGTQFKAGPATGEGIVAQFVDPDKHFVDLVIAIGSSKTYEISGLQDGKIILDLTNVQGLAAKSVFNAGTLFFNQAGEFTAVYEFTAGTLTADSTFVFTTPAGRANPYVMQGANGAGITVKSLTDQMGAVVDDKYTAFDTLTKLTATFTKDAVSLGSAVFGNYTVAISESGNILVQDSFKLAKTFSNNSGANGQILDEGGTLLAEVSGGKLYIAKVLSTKENIVSGDLTVNSLTLNFNAGKKDKVTLVKLEGSYVGGSFTLNDASLTKTDEETGVTATVVTSVYFDSRIDYKNDNDYIAIVRYEIDLSKIEDSTSFDLASDSDGNYYTISGNNITKAAVGSASEVFLTENRGDCYDGALAAKPVGGTAEAPAFYAAARYIGGNHVDNNNDKLCDLCGASFAEHFDKFGANMWDNQYGSGRLATGDVVDIWGTYEAGTNPTGRMTVAVQEFGASGSIGYTIYGMDSSGWGLHKTNEWGGEDVSPYHKPEGVDAPTSGSEDFTRWKTPLPNNTLLGTEAFDGSGTITDETLAAVLNNGATVRSTVIVTSDVFSVRFRIYRTADMTKTPYADFTFTLDIPEGATYAFDYTGVWGGGGTGSFDKNGVTVVRDKLTHNVLSGATVANNAQYEAVTSGATVDVSGMADKNVQGSNTHSVEFTLHFAQALVASTKATVVGVADATATLNEARNALTVHIPLNAASAKSYKIHFENTEASTIQSDITVDLANLAVTEYAVTETNELTLTGGTLTLAITGATANTTFALGGVSKAYGEIKVNDAFGTLKVTAVSANSISFEQTALDFSKKIENYVAQLTDSTGKILVYKHVGIKAQVSGTNVVDNQVLLLAEGSKLTLVVTNGVGEGQTKELSVNVNMGGAADKVNLEQLNAFALDFKVQNGAVTFAGSNLLTQKATLVYSAINGSAVAIHLDLTDLGIVKGDAEDATDPAYGLQVLVGSANAIYKIASDRTISALPAQEVTPTVLQAETCTKDGVSAKAYTEGSTIIFWYDVAVVKASHKFTAAGGECSACHEVTGWKVENVLVGAADFSTAESVVEHGNGKAYYPTGLATNSVIVRGQTVTFEGHLTQGQAGWANMTGVSALFATTTDANPIFFRTDNYINGLGNPESQTDDATRGFKVAKAITMNGSTNVDYGRIKNIRDNAEATISFAWIKGEDPVEASEGVEAKPGTADKIVITMTFVGITTQGTQVSTYTITPAEGLRFKESKYAFGLSPVKGCFTGSVTAIADKDDVPAADCNPSKHTHVYDATTGRCPSDGELNPAHTHNYVGGVCVCGNADLAVLDTLATKVETFTNSDANEAWWNGVTDSVALTGNYVLKATYKNASKAFPEAVAEVNVSGTDPIQCLDVRMDNATNPKDIWGLLYEGAVKQVVTTGTQPTEGNWKGDFTVYTWRKGNTFGLVMSFTPEGASAASYSLSITGTGFTTAENVAFLFVGNPYGLTDFVVKTGAIPAETPSTTVD